MFDLYAEKLRVGRIETLNLGIALISEKNQKGVGSLLLYHNQNKVYATLQSTDLNEYSFERVICQAQTTVFEFIRLQELIVSPSDRYIAEMLIGEYQPRLHCSYLDKISEDDL